MQIVNDAAEAESLMHESFLLAFDHIDAYNGDISFSSWVNKFISSAVKNGLSSNFAL
jgi:DNA-directed RNA polymerase specialized sigma24 family protein